MTERKIRIALAAFCAALTAALGVFVWIMMDASQNSMSDVLRNSLLLVGLLSVVTQAIYAMKAQIFEQNGRLATREILFSIICFQLIVQLGFGFSLYAVNQTVMQNESFDSAYNYFVELQHSVPENNLEAYMAVNLNQNMPECVESVVAVAEDDFSDAKGYFRFPITGGKLLMKKSSEYFNKKLRDFAIDMLMSLIISILLMIELVFFAAKYLDSRSHSGEGTVRPASYLRQMAFLFYFTGYLGSSFVPILARELSAGNPNADFIAGLPYSVEAFANCLAIVITAPIFRRRGWKLPYLSGALVFIVGMLLSALAPNAYLFILARGVVGVGYGLCWMTMRNITSISGDRAVNFSSLTSGIYAGIMCGAAFGAVLADSMGYKGVLLLSAAFSLVAVIFPISIRNEKSPERSISASSESKVTLKKLDIGIFAAFLLIIVIPTCIAEAFKAYVSPLYLSGLGLPTAYVGRVTLVYNFTIVYISSTLMLKLVTTKVKNTTLRNTLHLLLISLGLFISAYLGGFQAMLIAAAVFGSADGFGSSVQNAYVLDTQVSRKIGSAHMLTFFSLFKKFGAMLGPIVFGLFMRNGIQGLGYMGFIYLGCAVISIVLIAVLQRHSKKEGMA